MVTCEASGAWEHGHDSKQEESSGRTNNASKGVDERVWVVQQVEHADTKVTKRRSSRCRKLSQGGARSHHGWSARAGQPAL
jgi:hypothetical protein